MLPRNIHSSLFIMAVEKICIYVVELEVNFVGWIMDVLRTGTVSGVGIASPVAYPRTAGAWRVLAADFCLAI